MNAIEKLKHLIVLKAIEFENVPDDVKDAQIDANNINEIYDQLVEDEGHWDAQSETREGEVETDIPCQSSRHYESKSVAARYLDGSWIGWTYWYGGGKHGEPEAVDWIEYAYDLTVTEEEKVVTVRTFARAGAA